MMGSGDAIIPEFLLWLRWWEGEQVLLTAALELCILVLSLSNKAVAPCNLQKVMLNLNNFGYLHVSQMHFQAQSYLQHLATQTITWTSLSIIYKQECKKHVFVSTCCDSPGASQKVSCRWSEHGMYDEEQTWLLRRESLLVPAKRSALSLAAPKVSCSLLYSCRPQSFSKLILKQTRTACLLQGSESFRRRTEQSCMLKIDG